MKKEREQEAIEVLKRQKKERTGTEAYVLMGEDYDKEFKENIAIYPGFSDRFGPDSKETEELMARGFKVIYPAELSQEQIDRMDDEKKKQYQMSLENPMIIDSNERPSLQLAQRITHHYFSQDPLYGLVGYDTAKNTISPQVNQKAFKEGSLENLYKMLNELGYETSLDQFNHPVIHSDIPYPAVKKSKFAQIYDKAKSTIQNAFAKLKSLVNKKEPEKENNTDEQEL